MTYYSGCGPDLVPPIGDLSALGRLAERWDELASRAELSEELQRTAFWSVRLMIEFAVRGIAARIRGFRFASFGFIDPDGADEAFGVIAYGVPTLDLGWEIYERVADVEVGGHSFPVVVRRAVELRHSPGLHPAYGTAACWGRSRVRSSNPLGPGIVTAKHVVSSAQAAVGGSILLSNRSAGSVLDIAPDGIDAALVQTSESAGTSPLRAVQLVAPWADVTFHGAASGMHATKITSVTDTRGALGLSSAAVPARVFLADHGRQTDSGALVRDQRTGQAVGIYLGALTDPAARTEGYGQHMYQATQVMDMELFD